jgi:hypothetical protein
MGCFLIPLYAITCSGKCPGSASGNGFFSTTVGSDHSYWLPLKAERPQVLTYGLSVITKYIFSKP